MHLSLVKLNLIPLVFVDFLFYSFVAFHHLLRVLTTPTMLCILTLF